MKVYQWFYWTSHPQFWGKSPGFQSSLVPPCKISLGDPGDADNDSQSDSLWFEQLCSWGHGTRWVFSSIKNEQKYPWLYHSVVHQGYLYKFCELFCGHSSSSQEFVTVGINLGIVTGPNGIMMAQTFCDIFFMKKWHQISIYKQFSD